MKSQIWAVLQVQYSVAGIFLLLVLLWNYNVVFSAFVGVLAAVVPNSYFAFKMLKRVNNKDAVQWLGYAYRSEFGKWLMTGVIFVLVFTSDYAWNYKVLLAGFIFMQFSSWFTPLMVKNK